VTNESEELHDELRDVARRLLGAGPPDWVRLAEVGWTGLEVPEDLGGAGVGFAEVAVVAEELGRALAAVPYLGTVVLGAGALALAAPGPGRDGLLAAIARGTARVAVALPGGDGDAGGGPPPFRLAGGRLDGTAGWVPDAGGAGRLLVPAAGEDGRPVLVAAAPGAPGLAVAPAPILDATRDLATVTADGVAVEDEAVWPFAGDPGEALDALHRRAALAVAADALGVAGAMLDATVAYAQVRVQFGRPIGSFQAVKHACADRLVQLSASRALVAEAAAALDAGDGGAGVAVAMAKAHAGSMAVEVAGAALQLHGGIGYTWESGVHAHLKRAMADRSLYGSPRAHRALLAARHRTATV
jgi:alkylation response protein AidB-like acyl-CoA dehydrogenase